MPPDLRENLTSKWGFFSGTEYKGFPVPTSVAEMDVGLEGTNVKFETKISSRSRNFALFYKLPSIIACLALPMEMIEWGYEHPNHKRIISIS